MRGVTLKQLRTFAAAVRSGSLSAAARQLNITPPAVTLQMQLLEESIGMPIAERTQQGWQPTDAGRELLLAADRMQAALDDCEHGIGLLKGVQAGKVSVSVVSTAKYFAPRMLAAFLEQFPDVELSLSVGNREQTIDGLRRFQTDIAIMGRPPTEFPLDTAAIGENPHIIVAHPEHALAREQCIPRAALGAEVFLMRETGSGTRMLVDGFLAETGLSPRVGMEISSNETIKQAVMAGLGIALISANTVMAEVASGRIAILAVDGTPIRRQWFVVKRQERRLMPAAERLWGFLMGEGRGLLEKFFQLPPVDGNGTTADAGARAPNGAGGKANSL